MKKSTPFALLSVGRWRTCNSIIYCTVHDRFIRAVFISDAREHEHIAFHLHEFASSRAIWLCIFTFCCGKGAWSCTFSTALLRTEYGTWKIPQGVCCLLLLGGVSNIHKYNTIQDNTIQYIKYRKYISPVCVDQTPPRSPTLALQLP